MPCSRALHFLLVLIVFTSVWADETVNSPGPLQITITGGGATYPLLIDRYYPRVSAFSSDVNEARRYASEEWNQLSLTEQGNYIRDTYAELNRVHGYNYSTRVMTCKVYRETAFNPQHKAGTSSASGLAQVTSGTAQDIFNPQRLNFNFITPGYDSFSDSDKYMDKMADSMVAQMELGLAAIRLKDPGGSGENNMRPILERYFGDPDNPINNQIYANNIMRCATCIKNNKDVISPECLAKAKENLAP
jgi:hypothetical protein